MKPSVTIGISAFNEEQNIGHLIRAVLVQKITSAVLTEIIVISDKSTDSTDSIVDSIKDTRISLIKNDVRQGINVNLNTIAEKASGDILVILDADIMPEYSTSIETLIAPLIANTSAGLVSGRIVPARPKTFVEKILARNHLFKTVLFQSLKKETLYLCFGPARAFSKALYSELRYPDNCPVDAYSYLYAQKQGYGFIYSAQAAFTFRCPDSVADHAKQTNRFIASRDALATRFGRDMTDAAYALPLQTVMIYALRELLFHPVLFISYIILTAHTRYAYSSSGFNSRWDIATSSKKI